MSKEIYISCTPHETRLAIVENDALAEIYYERENEYTLAGSIYNGRVTRVLPGMQSAFVDIGLERDAFLYITDFMEEAGDSAEFEGAERSARGDRGGDRSGAERRERGSRGDRSERGDRSDRGDNRSETRSAEPTDEELFTSAVAGLEPGRSTEGGRNERGGRRRGGRDRQRSSEGSTRREAPESVDENRSTPEGNLAATETGAVEELGEGQPGADGSRRWRGRRGRRGRGNGGENRTLREASSSEAAPEEAQAGFEQDHTVAEAAEPVAEVDQNPEGQMQDEARSSGRGRRERGRSDRGQSGRGQAGSEGGRTPRGFAPSVNLYQVEGSAERPYGAAEELPERPAEPFLLPGESLARYRPGSAAEPEAPAAQAAPAPEFLLSGVWDGSGVMPGETIRPRANSGGGDAGPERGRRDSGRGDRGRGDRGGRDRRPAPEAEHVASPAFEETTPRFIPAVEPPVEATAFAEEAQHQATHDQPAPEMHSVEGAKEFGHAVEVPAEFAEVQPEPGDLPLAQELPAERAEASHGVDTSSAPYQNSTHVPPPPMPSELEGEYEPVEASASFRIDPVPPSEYRQAAPAVEAAEPEEHEPATEQAEAHGENAAAEPSGVFADAGQPAGNPHETTTLTPEGDMHSEASGQLLEPEQELQEETVSERELELSGFAPGDGLLEEEEMVEEDESSLPSLQAASAGYGEREADGHEQEALEVVADLGSMLRERSIDDLLHLEPAGTGDDLEDGEEFEEDFLEEDADASEEVDTSSEDQATEPFADERAEPERSEGTEEGIGREEAAAGDEPRRESRREGRRGDRGRRGGGSDRSSGRNGSDRGSDRGSDHGGERSRDSRGGRGSRQSMQTTNLPAISDLLKPGQEILCQIAKEPIAKKGARITSHIALPGRFLVFMPTVHHTGVSRKIESDGERRRLKEILLSEKGEAAGGFIVRTAAAGASEEELRSDLRFLLNLWADIKQRSDTSKSPALIYHDLNLIERVLRDQVTDNFSAIWVDNETEYEKVLRFLQRFQPSLLRRVKLYTKETPLYEQFGITDEINKALRSKVWLKSGGSIVINQTEALVAIDINTGKYVGKTARLEDTIVKTNLDAIPEIVRQIRLRDLGGIIIIDFIDMDERKNRNRVMAALEEELKQDRAPSKVLQFNDFGLVAITRKRVKQSLERTLSTTCGVCAGTGMTKSPITVCNDIYVEMRKMQKHLDRGDVMLRVNPEVVKQLKAPGTHWLQEMEEMVGKTILIKSDPSLHPEQFDIH